jgi:chemotaxis protein CheD
MNTLEVIETHYLFPSSVFTSATPCQVTTVLGSCVSVCLVDVIKKTGGINHYMLPLWNGSGLASPKYGNIAIEKLIEKMISMGSKKENLQAKVFGGGNVLESNINFFNVGERNHNLAIELLGNFNIPVVAKSLGGDKGRKIIFNTTTGEVMMKFLNRIST